MQNRYERIAIVTGATSGIGEATARTDVASGYGVAARGRRAAKCEAIRFAASRPPNVPIGDIVVRPTRQVYL